MFSIREQYIVDNNGKRVSVIIDISDYRKLLKEL